jgi:hypothetical protein
MDAVMRVLSPLATHSITSDRVARRPPTLDDQVIGLMTNGKQNADVLLEAVAEELRTRFALKELRRENKAAGGSGPSQGAPVSMLDRLASGTVAVLVASGD